MFKDFIYDFDGTISDTYPVATRILCEVLKEKGTVANEKEVYAYLKISYGAAFSHYGLTQQERAVFSHRVVTEGLQLQQPFKEALELFRTAAALGKRNFIYTHSGKEVGEMLEKWGLAPYVTYILDNTMSFPRKPDPAALTFLCDKFDICPANAIMVGDRDIDIEVGHRKGMAGCLFDEGNYYPMVTAEYRVQNLKEIMKLF